jgi:hypothetical protein
MAEITPLTLGCRNGPAGMRLGLRPLPNCLCTGAASTRAIRRAQVSPGQARGASTQLQPRSLAAASCAAAACLKLNSLPQHGSRGAPAAAPALPVHIAAAARQPSAAAAASKSAWPGTRSGGETSCLHALGAASAGPALCRPCNPLPARSAGRSPHPHLMRTPPAAARQPPLCAVLEWCVMCGASLSVQHASPSGGGDRTAGSSGRRAALAAAAQCPCHCRHSPRQARRSSKHG